MDALDTKKVLIVINVIKLFMIKKNEVWKTGKLKTQ